MQEKKEKREALRILLDVISQTDNKSLFKLLSQLHHDYPHDQLDGRDLHEAIRAKDCKKMDYILKFNPRLIDRAGSNALMTSISSGSHQTTKLLFEYGASCDENQNIPTHVKQLEEENKRELVSSYYILQELYPRYQKEQSEFKTKKACEVKTARHMHDESNEDLSQDYLTILDQAEKSRNEMLALPVVLVKKSALFRNKQLLNKLIAQLRTSIEKYSSYNEKNSKCAICLEDYDKKPHIKVCKNGHSLCLGCFNNPTIESCPLCRGACDFSKLETCQSCGINGEKIKLSYCIDCKGLMIVCDDCPLLPCGHKKAMNNEDSKKIRIQWGKKYLHHLNEQQSQQVGKIITSTIQTLHKLKLATEDKLEKINNRLETIKVKFDKEKKLYDNSPRFTWIHKLQAEATLNALIEEDKNYRNKAIEIIKEFEQTKQKYTQEAQKQCETIESDNNKKKSNGLALLDSQIVDELRNNEMLRALSTLIFGQGFSNIVHE